MFGLVRRALRGTSYLKEKIMCIDDFLNNGNLPPGYEDPGENMIPAKNLNLDDYIEPEEEWEE